MNRNLVGALVSLVLVFSTAGCATTSTSGVSGTQADAPTLSEAQLKSILVSKLSSDCTGLNAYMLSPANWQNQGASPSGDGTEFVLPGDGGSIALDVLPDGTGGANVVIADIYADVTNINLYNSGCKTLASAPVDSNSGDTSSGVQDNSNNSTQNFTNNQPTGHYAQQCNKVWVSNEDPNQNGTTSIGSWVDQCQQVWVNN